MPKKPKPLPVEPADLRRVREEAGLSQQALADKMGVRRELVSAWERGKTRFGLLRLTRFADALGVDFTYHGEAVVFTPRGD